MFQRGIVNIKNINYNTTLATRFSKQVLKIGSQNTFFENTLKKRKTPPFLEQLYLIITNLQNINYNTIYTLGLYNGLFVKRIIKRSNSSLDTSLQCSQVRHLRHTYFSHPVPLTRTPLHLRTVMFSQNPVVSQALLFFLTI